MALFSRWALDPKPAPAKEDDSKSELRRLAWVAIIFVAAGVVATLMTISPFVWLRSAGILFLTGLAAGAAGAALGFLFGIPRVHTPDGKLPAVDATDSEAARAELAPTPVPVGRRLLSSNSNLEQVSDWLTKIIVGLSLVELHRLNGLLLDFRVLVADYVPPTDIVTPLAAVVVLIFAAVLGFLWMYLETRLVLSRIFGSVEQYLNALLEMATEKQRTAEEQKNAALGALARSGGPQQARDLLPPVGTDPSTDVSQMQVALYEPPPTGFQRVIEIAAGLSRNPVAIARADYWFYQGAAFGQQYAWRRANQPDGDLASSRDNALTALRTCVRIDPSYRSRIRRLMYPAQSSTPSDDDLAPFAGDADFEALIK